MPDAASPLTATVIVRALNRASTIGRTIESLRRQTHDVEIVVVDSGSTHGTVEIARASADQLLQIPPSTFTFGHALNVGAEVAGGDVHFALSAHCFAPTPTWIADSLRHYENDLVAGTSGAVVGPDGMALQAVYRPTYAEALTHPFWGFSNHASSWRAQAWRDHPFREDLGACEDKEWSWRVLQAGWRLCFDRALFVPSAHRREQGLRASWLRIHREAKAFAIVGFPSSMTVASTARLWWSDFSMPSKWPPMARRLNPHRAVEYWAAYAGSRAGVRLQASRRTYTPPENDSDRERLRD